MTVDHLIRDAVRARRRRPQQGNPGTRGDDEHRCSCPREEAAHRCESSRLRQHSRLQEFWGRIIRCRLHEPTERLAFGNVVAAVRAAADVLTERLLGGGIELPVEIGVQIAMHLFTAHRSVSLMLSASA